MKEYFTRNRNDLEGFVDEIYDLIINHANDFYQMQNIKVVEQILYESYKDEFQEKVEKFVDRHQDYYFLDGMREMPWKGIVWGNSPAQH